MALIDPEAPLPLQTELNSGESLMWAGEPSAMSRSSPDDLDSVYRLILDLCDKDRSRQSEPLVHSTAKIRLAYARGERMPPPLHKPKPALPFFWEG